MFFNLRVSTRIIVVALLAVTFPTKGTSPRKLCQYNEVKLYLILYKWLDGKSAGPAAKQFFGSRGEGDDCLLVRVNADAEQSVAIAGTAVFPGARDANGILGNSAEARLIELFGLDVRAIVIVQR